MTLYVTSSLCVTFPTKFPIFVTAPSVISLDSVEHDFIVMFFVYAFTSPANPPTPSQDCASTFTVPVDLELVITPLCTHPTKSPTLPIAAEELTYTLPEVVQSDAVPDKSPAKPPN